VVFAGLMPVTGVGGDAVVNSALHPLLPLAASRRLVLFNRRARLPRGMTMAELAAEHAEALRDAFAAPVDLAGTSTGGSIAAQLSADHGELVGRLALISAACRLGPVGKHCRPRSRHPSGAARIGAPRRSQPPGWCRHGGGRS
jgi:pimeloyl-ACP methyl ester carboxylesterase